MERSKSAKKDRKKKIEKLKADKDCLEHEKAKEVIE